MANETDRYNLVWQSTGLTKKDFADSLGLSKMMGFRLSAGEVKPSREVLAALASKYGVNLHWLLTGSGNPGLPSVDDGYVRIELLDQEAAAGQGMEIGDYIDRRVLPLLYDIVRPHNPAKLKAVNVSGDSMKDESICDGDIVIFNTQIIEGNGIFVVSIGTTLVVKRVDFDLTDKAIILISANQAYEPRRIEGVDLEQVKILGKVVATYHKV